MIDISATDQNKHLVTRLLSVFETGDLDELNAIVASDYQHNITGLPQGCEVLKQYITALRTAVPDVRMPILDLVAEGDRVAVRNRVVGTQQGDFGPWKAKGNRFDVTVFHIYRVADGLITEHWETIDNAELQKQLTA